MSPVLAVAHATVVALDPGSQLLATAPPAVTITLSEPATPFGRGIEVIAPSGRLVSGATRAEGARLSVPVTASELGTYLVEWRVVAQDTHPSRGSYTFSVGHAGPPPVGIAAGSEVGAVAPLGLLLQVLSRWLHLVGYALAFGTMAFVVLVLGRGRPEDRLRWLVNAGIVLLVAAEPIALVAQAASLGSVDSPALADVLGSAFGRVLALRLGAALLLWGMLGALRAERGAMAWGVLGLGAALALVDGLAGHTIRGQPPLLGDLLTALHVGSMVVWVGGFLALVAVLPGARDKRGLTARFGRLAAIAVGVLLLSGGILALVHLNRPPDLLFTTYGLTLAVKLLAVAVALAAAWFGLRSFRSGRPEALALAGVVAIASLLASLPPVR